MAWLPEDLIKGYPPPSGSLGLVVRPLFSGSDPGVVTVRLESGSISLSGTFGERRPGTSAHTVVGCSVSSSILAASNTGRLGMSVFNSSDDDMFVMLGPGASTSQFSFKLISDAYYEVPFPVYTGVVTCVWRAGASGSAQVTELTE